MRKVFLLLVIVTLFAMCKSKQASSASAPAVAGKPDVQYKDDFRAASSSERTALLKKLRATGASYSIIIFTKGYKGEKVVVSNGGKTIYSGNVISNLKTGIAEQVRILNTTDAKVYDSFTKSDVIIPAEESQKHKYIYLMKDNDGKGNPFTVTYSNTLRPLR